MGILIKIYIHIFFIYSQVAAHVMNKDMVYMGRVKQKSTFEHAQTAPIQIILRMHKGSSSPSSSFIHSVVLARLIG